MVSINPVTSYVFKTKKYKNFGYSHTSGYPFLLAGVFKTKDIFECAQFYKTLLHKKYTITLENNFEFSFYFTPDNFFHLIGLGKLKDINYFKGKNKNLIFKKILKKEIPLESIEKHKNYCKIINRVKYFERIDKLLDKKHSKIIIDFDSDNKLLKTVFIFYAHEKSGYTHLTIGKDNAKYYPETFIYEDSKRYISGQELLNIIDIKIEYIGKNKSKKDNVFKAFADGVQSRA